MHFPTANADSSWKPAALVIDKDADIHRSIHVMIGKEYDVHHAYYSRVALSLLEKGRFNVVFTSLNMGSVDEMPEFHRTIQSISKEKGIPVIDLSSARSTTTEAAGNTKRNFESDSLLAALRHALPA